MPMHNSSFFLLLNALFCVQLLLERIHEFGCERKENARKPAPRSVGAALLLDITRAVFTRARDRIVRTCTITKYVHAYN